VTPHFVKPIAPGEKIAIPEMPATFLPAAPEPKSKSPKKGSEKEPQFVGPRGQQIPK
jgi:hypothetical protein